MQGTAHLRKPPMSGTPQQKLRLKPVWQNIVQRLMLFLLLQRLLHRVLHRLVNQRQPKRVMARGLAQPNPERDQRPRVALRFQLPEVQPAQPYEEGYCPICGVNPQEPVTQTECVGWITCNSNVCASTMLAADDLLGLVRANVLLQPLSNEEHELIATAMESSDNDFKILAWKREEESIELASVYEAVKAFIHAVRARPHGVEAISRRRLPFLKLQMLMALNTITGAQGTPIGAHTMMRACPSQLPRFWLTS